MVRSQNEPSEPPATSPGVMRWQIRSAQSGRSVRCASRRCESEIPAGMVRPYQFRATICISELASERFKEETASLNRRGGLAIGVLSSFDHEPLVKMMVLACG